jgi:cholesterol oxidase
MDFDTIVIGSGFGGAVTACRLAEAGARVLVLERGRRWATAAFPRAPTDAWVYDVERPEHLNGWIDLRVFPHVAVAQGAGVGGGSLIYANVSVVAQPFAFEGGWPAEITYAELQPHYARVGEMLAVAELPDGQLTERHKLMRDAAAAIGDGARLRKLPLAVTFDPAWSYDLPDATDPRHSKPFTNAFGKQQGTCIHCGSCDLGCPVGARNTLDLNYLALAEQKGAEIRPLHLVNAILPVAGGYRVNFDRIDGGARVAGSETAARVVIAAGSLGSTELLLRSRDQFRTLPNVSARLGQGWCANGDFLTPAVYLDHDIAPTRGPTITTAIDYLDGSDGGHRYFVEDGGFPDVIGNAVRAAFDRGVMGHIVNVYAASLRLALGHRDPEGHVMPWFGQGADFGDGVMSLSGGPPPHLHLAYDVTRSAGVVQAMIDRHKQLSKATGGHAFEPVSWTWLKYLVTPHPLGGCNMGSTAADGVVDHRGEVFGYPGLYVLDGAIVPRALGLNPSRTIAALAERGAALMLQ